MLIAIHRMPESPRLYPARWAESLKERGEQVRWVDLFAPDAIQQVSGCDGVMCQFRHATTDRDILQRVLMAIELGLGIPAFPDLRTGYHYDDKVAQLYLFQNIGAPMPRTWLFRQREEAIAWARRADYPVVFKLAHGAGSDNICRVRNAKEAQGLISKAFGRGLTHGDLVPLQGAAALPEFAPWWKRLRDRLRAPTNSGAPDGLREQGHVYFQEFLPGNPFDTRLVVIGDRAWGFTRGNRDNDFRASGSGRIDYDVRRIHPRCVTFAFEIAQKLRLASAGFDFLFKNGVPVVVEMTYVFGTGGEAVSRCPGQWRPDGSWEEGVRDPVDAQVEGLLSRARANALMRAEKAG